MLFDKLSLFADGLTVPTTANTTTYSKVIDFRKCNLIDGCLKVYAQVCGAVNATGSVTTKLQVSADGLEWTDLVSFVQNEEILAAAFLPICGKKRFARLAFVVGGTSLGSAISVKAGLVDQFEVAELPTPQTYPPLEDLTVVADKICTALALAATTKSITKGSNSDIAVTSGVPSLVSAPAGYTVTCGYGKVNIALASSAASGSVVLVGGLGDKVTVAVTAAS